MLEERLSAYPRTAEGLTSVGTGKNGGFSGRGKLETFRNGDKKCCVGKKGRRPEKQAASGGGGGTGGPLRKRGGGKSASNRGGGGRKIYWEGKRKAKAGKTNSEGGCLTPLKIITLVEGGEGGPLQWTGATKREVLVLFLRQGREPNFARRVRQGIFRAEKGLVVVRRVAFVQGKPSYAQPRILPEKRAVRRKWPDYASSREGRWTTKGSGTASEKGGPLEILEGRLVHTLKRDVGLIGGGEGRG